MNSTDFVSTGRTAIALANGDFSASLEVGPQNGKKEAKRLKKGSFSQTLIKAKKPENHMQISIT